MLELKDVMKKSESWVAADHSSVVEAIRAYFGFDSIAEVWFEHKDGGFVPPDDLRLCFGFKRGYGINQIIGALKQELIRRPVDTERVQRLVDTVHRWAEASTQAEEIC